MSGSPSDGYARPRIRLEAPPAALWAIALVALVPFPASAVMYCYGPVEHRLGSLTILFTWSSIILSFIAGVRWGLETREPAPRWYRLAFYALCAGTALVVMLGRGTVPDSWMLALFIGSFMIQWLFDNQVPDTPSRYPSLSTALTAAACVSLALALEKTMH
jgi:hypothetical protein